MKKITFLKYLAILGFTVIAIPLFAKADTTPTLSVVNNGASDISQTQAAVSITFNSGSATYDFTNVPSVYLQYTNIATGVTQVTATARELPGSRSETFWLYNLTPNTQYSYQVVTSFNGGKTFSSPSSFTTIGTTSHDLSSPIVINSNSAATATTTVSLPTAPATTTGVLGTVSKVVGVATLEKNITNNVATGGVAHANGIVLYITDEHARVYQNDSLTFTVKAQNTNNVDILDSRVVVSLPDQYQFSSSSFDVNYDSRANTVTYPFGRIAAGVTKTLTFSVDAVGEGNGTVHTDVTLQYAGGNLSTSDHDAYSSGTKSVLGASVFGAGFFPQTFTGWFLILLLIVLIIIGARRYVKAPKPVTPAPAK
jgi:hypothetical protein